MSELGVIAYASLGKMTKPELIAYIKRNRPYVTNGKTYPVSGKNKKQLQRTAREVYKNMR